MKGEQDLKAREAEVPTWNSPLSSVSEQLKYRLTQSHNGTDCGHPHHLPPSQRASYSSHWGSRQLFCSWIKVHAVLLVSLSKALSSLCGKLFCLHCFTVCYSALSLPHFSSLFPLPFKQHLSLFPIQCLWASLLSALCKTSMPSLPFITFLLIHIPACLSPFVRASSQPVWAALSSCPFCSSPFVSLHSLLWPSDVQQSAACSMRMLC